LFNSNYNNRSKPKNNLNLIKNLEMMSGQLTESDKRMNDIKFEMFNKDYDNKTVTDNSFNETKNSN